MVGSQGKMMRLKPKDIDYIIDLIEKIVDALNNIRSAFFFDKKKPILSKKEIQQLQQEQMFFADNKREQIEKDIEKIDAVNPSITTIAHKPKLRQNKNKYDPKVVQAAKDKLSKAQTEYFKANIEPLQKQLKQHFSEHRTEILKHSSQGDELQQSIEAFINCEGEGDLVMIFFSYPKALFFNRLITMKNKVIPKLKKVKDKLESEQEQITTQQKQVDTQQEIKSKRETKKPRKAKRIEKKVQPRTKSDDKKPAWSRPEGLQAWAQIFDVHPNTISSWFKTQSIRNEQVSARKWRVDIAELPSDLVKKVRESPEDK